MQKASAFTTADVDALLQVVEDISLEKCWHNSVLVLGEVIGPPRVGELRALLDIDVRERLRSGASRSRVHELLDMAIIAYQYYLARHPGDTETRAFLRRGANPSYWLTGEFQAVSDISVVRDYLNPTIFAHQLAKNSIFSLAFGVSTSERRQVLTEVANDPNLPPSIQDFAQKLLSRI